MQCSTRIIGIYGTENKYRTRNKQLLLPISKEFDKQHAVTNMLQIKVQGLS